MTAEQITTSNYAEAEALAPGKSIGTSFGASARSVTARVTIVHQADGVWAVHAGWSVMEGLSDDPLSVRTPVSMHIKGSHAWVSAYYPSFAEAGPAYMDARDTLEPVGQRAKFTPFGSPLKVDRGRC